MSEGFPSMTALLGLLAIAGYQNKDKLSEWLGGNHAAVQPVGSGSVPSVPPAGQTAGAGGLGGLLSGLTGQRDASSFLGGGLNDLVDKFRQSGQGTVADSWVNHGPNQAIGPQQMEQAIGGDTLEALTRQTGLSRDELLARLARELPQAVDHYTPDGRLPPRA